MGYTCGLHCCHPSVQGVTESTIVSSTGIVNASAIDITVTMVSVEY